MPLAISMRRLPAALGALSPFSGRQSGLPVRSTPSTLPCSWSHLGSQAVESARCLLSGPQLDCLLPVPQVLCPTAPTGEPRHFLGAVTTPWVPLPSDPAGPEEPEGRSCLYQGREQHGPGLGLVAGMRCMRGRDGSAHRGHQRRLVILVLSTLSCTRSEQETPKAERRSAGRTQSSRFLTRYAAQCVNLHFSLISLLLGSLQIHRKKFLQQILKKMK